MTVPLSRERPPSLWEDLLEILYAPRAVFERRRETPAFGLALVILVLVLFGLTFAFKGVMEPVFDVEWKRNIAGVMKNNPQITAEQMEGFRSASQKWMMAGVAGTWLILPLLLGLTYWVVGKVLDSKAEIGQVMMVAVYACFPRAIESILNAVQVLVLPEESITSRYSITLGVGRFLDPSNNLLLAILGRIDVFTLWVTFLLGVGMMVMGKMSKERAILAAAIMWVLGGIIPALGALRAG